MPREKVLVTGANGFIGMNTVRKLKETKEVRNFNGDVRKISDWQKNLEGGEMKLPDLTVGVSSPHTSSGAKSLRSENTSRRGIIFLIAGVRTETDTDFSVNAHSIEHLFSAAVRRNKLPKRIILASSQAVYMGNDIPFKESDKPIPTTVYGQSKLLAEKIAEGWCRDFNIPLVILRYSTVFGSGIREKSNMSGPLFMWTKAALANAPIQVFQDGNQSRDYTHVDDVIRANILAIDLPSGIYNVGGGKPVKLLELANWTREAAESHSQIVVIGGSPSKSDPREMFSDTTKLQKYGWEPKRSAREAVKEFVAAYANFLTISSAFPQ